MNSEEWGKLMSEIRKNNLALMYRQTGAKSIPVEYIASEYTLGTVDGHVYTVDPERVR